MLSYGIWMLPLEVQMEVYMSRQSGIIPKAMIDEQAVILMLRTR